jgi:hypothetical protein
VVPGWLLACEQQPGSWHASRRCEGAGNHACRSLGGAGNHAHRSLGEREIMPPGRAKRDQEWGNPSAWHKMEDLMSGSCSPLMLSKKPGIAVALFWLGK